MDQFFKISERGSTVGREVRGGVVTFFTMAYIIVLNPLIIGTQTDGAGKFLGGGDTPNLPLVALATAIVAGLMTILMGVVARYPLALATGLGLNAFVTFSIAKAYTWTEAMTFVFLEGVIILLLVLTGFRVAVFKAVPTSLKTAISVGIGLFIALIGLVDAGFVRRTAVGPVPVELGIGGVLDGWPTLVFVFGLVLVVALYVRQVKGAILIAIAVTTVVAIVVENLAKVGPSFISPEETNPRGWQLNVPSLPGRHRQRAGALGPRGPVEPGDLRRHRRPARHRELLRRRGLHRDRAAGLHAAAGRLLRHHGHDDRDRRRGRPAGRAGHAAAGRSRSSSWTRWPPPPAVRRGSRRTRPTSSPRPASARVPGPVWPRW